MFTEFIEWLVDNDKTLYGYEDGHDHKCVRLDKLEDLFTLYLAEKIDKAKKKNIMQL